jgi:SEC-C motif-containing protein
MAQCPCGSGSDLDDCCGPIIAGVTPAPTAEAVMRSRFTAFVRGDLDHIKNTLVRAERDAFDPASARDMIETYEWTSLEILGTSLGGEADDTGTVNFAAHYKKNGASQIHHEQAIFRREEGTWVYVDGDINPKGDPVRVEKVGRNQPCPCGSGKKYKKCCGA